MSTRGMVLVLQRLHDDPGFRERVTEAAELLDPYELVESERQLVLEAVLGEGDGELRDLAAKYALDWEAERLEGVGAPETGSEARGKNWGFNQDILMNEPVKEDMPRVGHWGKGVDWGHPGYGSRPDRKHLPAGDD